jgi:DNA-binding NtrC family response regulator
MPSRSLLVVDDDRGTVETLKDILEAKTYRVASAYSGEAAVEMVRGDGFGAILMDIIMPGINGVDALRSIKAFAPGTNVIMMTAFTRHELVEQAKEASALAVLPKPLDMDRLLALLERATRK